MTQPLEIIGLAALSNAGDFRTSYELAARCIREGIPGDFVECGVFGGAQCAAMAKAILEVVSAGDICVDCHGTGRTSPFSDALECKSCNGEGRRRSTRRVHLFDSFEGVPKPGPEDRDFAAGGHVAGASACALVDVQKHMKQWGIPDELLVYHQGRFEFREFHYRDGKRIVEDPRQVPSQIALLRIDLDLYDGTRAAMRCMYPMLSPGGFCVIDDYALDGCRQAVNEYMAGGFPPITWQKP